MRATALLLAGFALFASTASEATITIYTNQAAFAAATSAPGTDTYTGFNITGSTASPIVRNAGGYSYTATTAGSFFGAGTTANPWLSTNTATDPVIFSNFSPFVSAIGGNFFGSDISGLFKSGDITLTAVDGSGSMSQSILNATTSSFLGFVSTSNLSSLTISAVQPRNAYLWPTIDNLTLARGATAAAVPESATWAMMIAGFGLVGYSLRRRSTKLALPA